VRTGIFGVTLFAGDEIFTLFVWVVKMTSLSHRRGYEVLG
jgi:hypothetical protein